MTALEKTVEYIIIKRHEAQKARDYVTADILRDILAEQGIKIQDTATCVKWRLEAK